MFFKSINLLGTIFGFTLLIWPFAFIFSFAYAIKDLLDNKKPTNKLIISSISLIIMLAGIIRFSYYH